MKISLEFNITSNHQGTEIMIEAENEGEKAILHLMAMSKTALIHRDSSIHESYKLTQRLFIRPEIDPNEAS